MTRSGALLVLMASAAAGQTSYDVLIRNGRVLDGSGRPGVMADVAIRGDRIAAVGKRPGASAKRTVDASGLVVSPGFTPAPPLNYYPLIVGYPVDPQKFLRAGVRLSAG